MRFESGTKQYRYFFRSLLSCLKTLFLPNSSWELDFALVCFSPDNACSIQNMCKKLPKYLYPQFFLFQIAVPENLMSLRCRNALCMKVANCVYDTKHLIVTNMHDCHLFWMKWMAIKHFWCIWGYFIVTIRVIWKENPFKCHFMSNVFIYIHIFIFWILFYLLPMFFEIKLMLQILQIVQFIITKNV